jgi:hypothetical protein
MKKSILIYGITLLAAMVLLAACGRVSPVPPTPTNDPRPVLTGAAQTAEARLTQMVQLTPSETPAPTPTNTPEPSPTAQPTVATTPILETSPTATQRPASTGADNAVLASETIPDGTRFNPGATFTKSRRMLNTGASTWTNGYQLVHVSDHLLGAASPAAVALDVPANQMADFTINMTAPNEAGTYRGYWRMRNAQGAFFGDLIWVEIIVGTGTAAPTAALTPGSTAAPSPTATQSASSAVSNVTVSIETPNITAACPYTYGINASFNLSQASAVTYQLEAGSSTPGFVFNLPGAQTTTFQAGTNQISFSLSMSNSVSGWIRLRITSPQDITSNEVNFSLTCQ